MHDTTRHLETYQQQGIELHYNPAIPLNIAFYFRNETQHGGIQQPIYLTTMYGDNWR